MQTLNGEATRVRSEKVRRYFTKTPPPPSYGTAVTLGVVAALCMLPALAVLIGGIAQRQWTSCMSCVSVLSALAALALAVPALLSYRRTKSTYDKNYAAAEPKPSDAEIDEFHRRDCEFFSTVAMTKLGLKPDDVRLDNKGKPLVIVGCGPWAQVRTGADGNLRFSSHEILVIYLTAYHLAAYKCIVELQDGSVRSETTHEYHYKDIVSVSTQRNQSKVSLYVDGQQREVMVNQRFTLSMSNGEQMAVATDVDESLKLGTTAAAGVSPEVAIRNIRARLRQTKGGAVDPGSLS